MAKTSRTGMTILGLVGVAVLSVGGTVLAAGGAHRHDDDSSAHGPMGGSMMGMMGSMMGGSMMGDADEWADHGRMMGMMGSMMGDTDEWADHGRMMDPSEMPGWMWEHVSEHMGVSASEAEPVTEAADEPASGTPSDEPEPAE